MNSLKAYPRLVNLGSGKRPFGQPWCNIDCQEKWTPHIVADGANLPMIADECVEIVVMHHVLEHFGCGEANKVIEECYRILAPGGSLIVTVPDIQFLVKGWIQNRIDTQILMTNLYGAYMGDEADRHKWGYTSISLTGYLRSAVPGWTKIKTFDFRPIEGADIAQDWWILGVEAVK